jgi:hypothetical protein
MLVIQSRIGFTKIHQKGTNSTVSQSTQWRHILVNLHLARIHQEQANLSKAFQAQWNPTLFLNLPELNGLTHRLASSAGTTRNFILQALAVTASRVSSGRNLEYRPDHEHAQELIIHQQGYHPAQDLDIIGYQPEEAGMEYFHETLPVAESEPSVMLIDLPEGLPSNSKQSEQRHGRRKRARETLVVDHNGVAM